MDILDTSALKSLSRSQIELISQRRPLAVSFISIYELLSHLDELVEAPFPARGMRSTQESFDYSRAQILKARGLRILYDPFAYMTGKVGSCDLVHADRYLESEAMGLMLLALETHLTLDDFYRDAARVSNGVVIEFRNCAALSRPTLEKLEREFVSTWEDLVAEITRLGITEWRTQINAQDGFWEHVGNCASLCDNFRRNGNTDPDLERKLFHVTFCYRAYVMAKIASRLNNNGIGNFTIDCNDFEDALICGYLDVLKDDILVTGDGRTIKALSIAFSAYDNQFPKQRRCAAMSPADYLKAYGNGV